MRVSGSMSGTNMELASAHCDPAATPTMSHKRKSWIFFKRLWTSLRLSTPTRLVDASVGRTLIDCHVNSSSQLPESFPRPPIHILLLQSTLLSRHLEVSVLRFNVIAQR